MSPLVHEQRHRGLETDPVFNPHVLLLQLQHHHQHKPHCLDQLGKPMILTSNPIFGPHNKQPVHYRTIPAVHAAVSPLFKGTNGVSPEGIVIVEVIKCFILPGIYVKEPLARTPIQGSPNNLQSLH